MFKKAPERDVQTTSYKTRLVSSGQGGVERGEMAPAAALRFLLLPIRQIRTKFGPAKSYRNTDGPARGGHSNFQHSTEYSPAYYVHSSAPGKSIFGGLLGVSLAIGSFRFCRRVAFSMDDDMMMGMRDFSGGGLEGEEEDDCSVAWMFVRKIWLPASFFLTAVVNWSHPVVLGTKLVLLLLATKPSPLSVYVFVQQLCQQSMRQQPYMYLLKSLYANKVEVQDYKVLCIAAVEVRGQKLTLIGILGGWWTLPLSRAAFSVFWDSFLY